MDQLHSKSVVVGIDGSQAAVNSWVRRYPDVPVQVVAAGTRVKSSENRSSAIELAIVGRADADQIAALATPNCHPIVGSPDCSMFIIRD
jgi:hypothetical protein